MSRENVLLVRNAVAAFNRRDVSALVASTAADFAWTTIIGRAVESRVYRGADGIARYFDDSDEVFEAVRLAPREFRDLGDKVVVVATFHARGVGSGADVEVPYFGVFSVRNGKLAEVLSFTREEEALQAVGLLE